MVEENNYTKNYSKEIEEWKIWEMKVRNYVERVTELYGENLRLHMEREENLGREREEKGLIKKIEEISKRQAKNLSKLLELWKKIPTKYKTEEIIKLYFLVRSLLL